MKKAIKILKGGGFINKKFDDVEKVEIFQNYKYCILGKDGNERFKAAQKDKLMGNKPFLKKKH